MTKESATMTPAKVAPVKVAKPKEAAPPVSAGKGSKEVVVVPPVSAGKTKADDGPFVPPDMGNWLPGHVVKLVVKSTVSST